MRHFGKDTIGVLAPAQAFTTLAAGRNVWASINVPEALFHECCARANDVRLQRLISEGTAAFRTKPLHTARLNRLVKRVVESARQGHLDDGRVAQSAENELVYAVNVALGDRQAADERSGGRPPFSRRVVVNRALDLIAGHRDDALHVTDLSQAAGVSERTLRNVFLEFFGIGPLAYIHMRQVHQVHQALMVAESNRTTVTNVAMRLGVWDLDALAARYRRVFGESPVSTLRKKVRLRRSAVR